VPQDYGAAVWLWRAAAEQVAARVRVRVRLRVKVRVRRCYPSP